MAWTAPKIDWSTLTEITYTLLNNIENNLRYLKGLDGAVSISANLSTSGELSVTGNGINLSGASPVIGFTETDQADPVGRFRVIGVAGALRIDRATGSAWATYDRPFEILSTGNCKMGYDLYCRKVLTTAGTQETGYCGVYWLTTAEADTHGQGVNFKTRMSNTPTSITLTAINEFNVGGAYADYINIYGFHLYINPTAASSYTRGMYTYATVGN